MMEKSREQSGEILHGRDDHVGFIPEIEDEVYEQKPVILLHSCCGPCSTAVVERLAPKYRIVIYFYNPNIDDEAEYKRRLLAQEDFVEQYNTSLSCPEPISMICGNWNPEIFHSLSAGFESEPEGGERCMLCIEHRMEVTAEYARMNGYPSFATTLSVSPHKDCERIASIGKRLAAKLGLNFVSDDFKKRNGYQRSVELSKYYKLYRQNYCGCGYAKYPSEENLVDDEEA